MPAVEIHPIVSMPFAENTFVAWRPGRSDALVVDPGTEPDAILAFLAARQLRPAVILNTHGHADHIAGNADMKEAFPDAPLVIGVNEAALLADPELNLSAPFGMPLVSPPADRLVADGETIDYAGFALEVREIPGHSPGHVVYVVHDDPPWVLGGDVLFRGGVGRTDFPGGSAAQLFAGIRARLFPLPPATAVYPGHGPATTVGAERRDNPFVGERPV